MTPIDDLDWPGMAGALDRWGAACTGPLLAPDDCAALRAMFDDDARFRATIDMARHGFGSGVYRYLAYPLPPAVDALRQGAYARLAPLANAWMAALGRAHRYPDRFDDFRADCHAAGQVRPTPLLLRYGPGDYNCLHQDVYGPLAFPFQLVILLSAPGTDFTGGAFALTEARPRRQSRVEVLELGLGEGAIFANTERPIAGARGVYAARLRHGVSRVHAGERMTLGIIFHDAA